MALVWLLLAVLFGGPFLIVLLKILGAASTSVVEGVKDAAQNQPKNKRMLLVIRDNSRGLLWSDEDEWLCMMTHFPNIQEGEAWQYVGSYMDESEEHPIVKGGHPIVHHFERALHTEAGKVERREIEATKHYVLLVRMRDQEVRFEKDHRFQRKLEKILRNFESGK